MITSHPFFQSSRARTLACLAFLFALNAYICNNLFHTEFTQETESVDVIFMAFSRWLAAHWNDRSWFPLWVTGTPVREVYNPALHHTVALLSRLSGWTAQHSYHFVTATTYSLGPLTLFWLCYRFTRRHGYALLTALCYSLFSPSALLVTAFRHDNGGLFGPRRLQTLVHYGEGPHVTALMLIPLVLWLLDEAAAKRRWMFLPLATFALAAVPLTNWTGTTGLMMALAAYVLAKVGAKTGAGNPLHWPTFIGIGVLAYALASYWIPPSLIRTVQSSAVNLDMVTPPMEKAAILAFLAIALLTLHFLFQRRSISELPRFFAYFALITGTAVLSKMWLGRVIIPIAHRFHLEMEMALAGAAAFVILAVTTRWPRRMQLAAVILLIAAAIPQARYYRRESRNTTKPTDVSNIPEARMARWFAENAKGQRVFAPGTVALWLNHYSDTPQFFGCCDQTVRTDEFRHALFNIYSADLPEHAITWLKVYGVSYIGVADTGGDQPFANPKKFDGVLEEVWRDGNSVIYRVPLPNPSLAHVVPTAALNIRQLNGGYDIEPLRPLLAALDNPASQAYVEWVTQSELVIKAHLEPGQSILLQQTCDPAWWTDSEFTITCGPLGLTKITTPGGRDVRIHLAYTWSGEDLLARAAQVGGLLLLAIWTFLSRKRN